MIPRTPEPELMLDEDQAVAYAAADFSAGDARVIDDLRHRFGDVHGRWVDLGCGPGNITFRLAEAFPGVEVTGVDGSEAMLRPALARLADHPAARRIRFLQARLPRTGLEPGSWDGVVSNSLLHHLHRPEVLWETILRLGRRDAAVLVSDLRRPSTDDEVARLVDRHTAGAPDVLRADFHNSLHAAFTVDEVRTQLADAGLDRALTVREADDRYLVVEGRLG